MQPLRSTSDREWRKLSRPAFTVFTPTYNRAHTLRRVYDSLERQTLRSFEWLVVDDGSTDGTRALVDELAATAGFPVRYVYRTNQGKHRACNLAVTLAEGELFYILDSDDALLPNALERFKAQWDALPADTRNGFVGVTGLCVDEAGELVGSRFPSSPLDSNSYDTHYRYGITGEKAGCLRTDVLRDYPFPEFQGEKFVDEGLVWNRISRRYRTRYVNEVFRIYTRDAGDRLSQAQARHLRDSPRGRALYYRELCALPIPLRWRLKYAGNYARSGFHAGRRAVRILAEAHGSRLLCMLMLPVGWLLYRRDLRRWRRSGLALPERAA